MSEEPKSIWKKSWTSPRSYFLAWLVLTTMLFGAGWLILLPDNGPISKSREDLKLLAALEICATMVMLLVFFIRWIRCWKNVRRFVFGCACFVTLIGLFYAEENWRGKHAWDQYVHERAAAGENMDWQAILPPPVPDDQNLAMCPLLLPLLDYTQTNGHNVWNDTNGIARVQRIDPRWNDGWPADKANQEHQVAEQELDANEVTNGWVNLPAWQKYFCTGTNLNGVAAGQSAAQDVLSALRFAAPDLAELQAEAGRRPVVRWPVHYDTDIKAGILLPHLADVRRLVRTLKLRSTARLATGDVPGALADMALAFRLADSPKAEPFVISILVRAFAWEDGLQPLHEGIARHQFSESQLAQIQQQLSGLDFLADYEKTQSSQHLLNSQLAQFSGSRWYDLFKGMNISSEDQAALNLLMRWGPKGWIYQNEVVASRLEDKVFYEAVDCRNHVVKPIVSNSGEAAVQSLHGMSAILSRLEFSAAKWAFDAPGKIALQQSMIDQSLVACALERYRLAHGEYPDALDRLVPEFISQLPHDVIGGQPLKYRREPNGRFLLYSIGWNETDDGGSGTFKNEDSGAGDQQWKQGDWVWQYPRS